MLILGTGPGPSGPLQPRAKGAQRSAWRNRLSPRTISTNVGASRPEGVVGAARRRTKARRPRLAAGAGGLQPAHGDRSAGTLARLHTHHLEVVDPAVFPEARARSKNHRRRHAGRVHERGGGGRVRDGDPTRDANPTTMRHRSADRVPHRRQFCDIIVEENDIYGDGVNVAARTSDGIGARRHLRFVGRPRSARPAGQRAIRGSGRVRR